MDFFGAQRTRTQRSLLLYGLFFLIVFVHMAVGLAIMALLLTLFTGGIYHWVLILVIVGILGSFIVGSFLEYRRLKAGGRAIARRVGAVRLFIDHSQDVWEQSRGIAHQHEPVQKVRYSPRHIAVRNERDFPPVYRRYYEIAQQLAIASGISMPILYVLPNEQGINGFVAGRHSQDMVLVVTQGALDKLSDEALYGLIGHEYGHILHGDAAFNLKLMVILAGLQILYDWSDPVGSIGSGRSWRHNNDNRNDHANEAQTANFKTHEDWVAYWQIQSQKQQSLSRNQSMWQQNRAATGLPALPSIWVLILHALSFSSMASAQLIKHSFNRERELLADATSVQLTRSPAIIETLKAIHQDSFGSRLTSTADINGLSHFFFASSGADLGDVSWFATHPSLAERMSAINANAYQSFAIQIAKEKRLNQQKIRQIYGQRRLGDWGIIKENSLSNKFQEKTQSESSPNTVNTENATNNQLDKRLNVTGSNVTNSDDVPTSSDSNVDNESNIEAETGLEFALEKDMIVNGRLQVKAQEVHAHKWLKPWQAKPDSNLPPATLISINDVPIASLPHYVLNHSHHALGAQALIEAVMLCHQGCMLSTVTRYDLTVIWHELPTVANHADIRPANATITHEQILPHTIDNELLERVTLLDRRLDSTLIGLAIKQLSRHDLSESAIHKLRLKHESDHSNQSYQHYIQQKKCRTMLKRYQHGMMKLFDTQITAELTKSFADKITDSGGLTDKPNLLLTHSKAGISQIPPILSLWQALHLQRLLPVLSNVLNNEQVMQTSWQQVLQAGKDDIFAQLDPSGQVFASINDTKRSVLILLAYRLSKDIKGQMTSAQDSSLLSYNDASVAHYIVHLKRHARLIDIELAAVSDANLQWLLLTAQSLNSIQLLALIEVVPAYIPPARQDDQKNNPQERQQGGCQIDYNSQTHDSRADHGFLDNPYDYNDYRQWLSTLHTMMLHDTIVSQDEYDCLVLLSERWLGVRKLF